MSDFDAQEVFRKTGTFLLTYGLLYPIYGFGRCICITFRIEWNGFHLCGNGARAERQRKLDVEHRRLNVPKPLPAKRKRALTLPLPAPGSEVKRILQKLTGRGGQRTADQRGSRLFQLPLEIREQIWEYVVGGQRIHVVSGVVSRRQQKGIVGEEREENKLPRRLGPVICEAQRPLHPDKRSSGRCGRCRTIFNAFGEVIYPITTASGLEYEPTLEASSSISGKVTQNCHIIQGGQSVSSPLALLLTCRQIYSEAITPLYSTNTFHFPTIQQVVEFTQTVLPHRLNLIKTIHLDAMFTSYYGFLPYEWTETLTATSRPQGLRKVVLRLTYDRIYGQGSVEVFLCREWERIFEPTLRFVKVMMDRNVDVEVWSSWKEFEWVRMELGGVKGLKWVRPDDQETFLEEW